MMEEDSTFHVPRVVGSDCQLTGGSMELLPNAWNILGSPNGGAHVFTTLLDHDSSADDH